MDNSQPIARLDALERLTEKAIHPLAVGVTSLGQSVRELQQIKLVINKDGKLCARITIETNE